jgi:glycopeptide antibiotics resistance protein
VPGRPAQAATASHVVPIASQVRNVQRTGLCALHVEFCKYRGLYRQVGRPFLILSTIALPLWLMLRLYRRRARGGVVSVRRELLLLTFVVYLLCVATLTLTPNRSERLRAEARGDIALRPNPAALTCIGVSSGSNARSFCMQNALGNVLLFLPLGFLLPLIATQLRAGGTMLVALALSLGIEVLQYASSALGSYRSADINDVILNTAGALVGLALVSVLRLRPRHAAPSHMIAR